MTFHYAMIMDTLGKRIAYIRNGMGLTQEQFAAALSEQIKLMGGDGRPEQVSRGAVANWEREAGITSRNQMAVADMAEASVDWLVRGKGDEPVLNKLAEIGRRYRPQARAAMPIGGSSQFSENIPILGTAAGAMTSSGAFSFNDEMPVGYAPMMPGLTGERDVYALFVEDVSMIPMYQPKGLVYVSPHRPPHKDDTVIVQEPESANGNPQAFIKIYIRENASELVTRQLNPDSNVTFLKKRGLLIHRVYPLRELAGV